MIATAEPLTDPISALAWTTLMIFALLLARRLGSGQRSAWAVVTACCGVVAVDKAIDLQSALYLLGQSTLGALDPYLGVREHRVLVRIVLVAPVLVLGVLGAVGIARRKRAWGQAERLSLLGLTLLLVYGGLRLLPGLGHLVDSATDIVLEVSVLLLIALSVRSAWTRGGAR
jgi:hypothetical protein